MATELKGMALALGLALATAAAAQEPDWSKATRIDIAMGNFNYTPSRIVLRHGGLYVFHVVNAAKGGHDLTARSFFAAARVAPADAPKLSKGSLPLAGGESADIRLVAPAAAIYEVHCSHFMHQTFGMKGEIVVE